MFYIFYDGEVFQTEADEYVAIKNFGDAPQDLDGWVLKDIGEGYPSFTFPSRQRRHTSSLRNLVSVVFTCFNEVSYLCNMDIVHNHKTYYTFHFLGSFDSHTSDK